MKLSIIIPCYNEEDTINLIIKKILQLPIKTQIIVVDDCSTDNSPKIIKSLIINHDNIEGIFLEKNQGKGNAIRNAQSKIKGDIVIIQDADLEYDPKDYQKLIDPILSGKYKVVYGSRVLEKNIFQNLKNYSHWIRIIGNLILTKLSNWINRQALTDAHTCYKVFAAEIFKKINLEEKGFSFCPEITTKIANMKIAIKEIPISYFGRDYSQGKKISTLDGLKAIITLFKYKQFISFKSN